MSWGRLQERVRHIVAWIGRTSGFVDCARGTTSLHCDHDLPLSSILILKRRLCTSIVHSTFSSEKQNTLLVFLARLPENRNSIVRYVVQVFVELGAGFAYMYLCWQLADDFPILPKPMAAPFPMKPYPARLPRLLMKSQNTPPSLSTGRIG